MVSAEIAQYQRLLNKAGEHRVVNRLCWFGLLLLHAAVLPSVWSKLGGACGVEGGVSVLIRLFGLSASACFFVLKVVDVPWQRMRRGWRSAAVAIAGVAWLHVGVVERAIAAVGDRSSARRGAVLFAGTLCHSNVTRWLLRLVAYIYPPIRLSRRPHACHPWRRAWEMAHLPYQTQCVPATSGPRAPPVF
jgi:hypothetical protein